MLKRIFCIMLALMLALSCFVYAADVTEEEVNEEEILEEEVTEEVIEDKTEAEDETEVEESADSEYTLDEEASDEEAGEESSEPVERISVVTGEYLLLKSLGILTEEECALIYSDTRVTRGKFMKLLAKISGMADISSGKYSGSFKDVNSETEEFPYIELMEDAGIINGDGSGRFFPGEYITYNHALTSAVKLLGYDVYAGAAGYPAGYLSAANSSGISSGVSADADGYISGENILKLLMNTLTVEVILQTSYGNAEKIEIAEGESYLEAVFGAKKEYGIIEANEYTGISDSAFAVEEGCVKINGAVYSAPFMDTGAEIGKKILFYAVYDQNGINNPQILWYDCYSSVKAITLDAREIIRASDYSVAYMKENYKEVKLPFAGDTNVVYNFKALPGYTYDHLDIDMGTVTMVDNDNNGVYEFINVVSYSEVFVEAVSIDDEIIYGSRGEVINLQECKDGYKVCRAGEEVGLSEVYSGMIVNPVISWDNEYCIIHLGNFSVTGTVNAVYEDENATRVVVDESEYLLSALATYVPAVGDYGTFYLNSEGEISLKDKVVTDEKYAYLMKLKTVGTVDKKHYFKLLTTSGIEVYETADKIALNGDSPKAADAVVVSGELFANGAEDGEGNITEQQLIRFKTDKNGKLDLIKTYSDYYNTYAVNNPYYKKDKDDMTFTLDYQSGATGYLTYYANTTNILGTRYLTNANTEVFFVPAVPTEDPEDYSAGAITSLTSATKYYNIEIYNLSEGYMTGAVVIRQNTSGNVTITNSNTNMVISKITKVYNQDEGETELKIYGYVRGAEKVYLVNDPDMIDSNASYGNGLGIKDLKPGDVIQVALDKEGYIAALRVLHCYNPETFTYRESSTSLATLYTALHSAIGNMIYRNDTTATFNCTPPDYQTGLQNATRDRAFNFTARTHFYKVNTKTGKVWEVKAADIPEGALVYFRSGYCYLNDVVYYE